MNFRRIFKLAYSDRVLAGMVGLLLGMGLMYSLQQRQEEVRAKGFSRKAECARIAHTRENQWSNDGDYLNGVVYSPTRNSCVVELMSLRNGVAYSTIDLLTEEQLNYVYCSHPECGGGIDIKIRRESEAFLRSLEK